MVAKSGISIQATKKGFIDVKTNERIQGRLENVLYSQEVPYNLLSVRRLQEKGMTIVFGKNGVTIKKYNKLIILGKPTQGLMGITFQISHKFATYSSRINKATHYELCH